MTATTFPRVSIVMPAYNAEKFIDASIKSVQEQTFSQWELLIVDDGSTDQTAARIRKAQSSDRRIRYFYQENKRLGAARNTGLRQCTAEWIAFLDSDDLWMPDKLEKQIEVATQSDVDFLFTSGYIVNEHEVLVSPYDSLLGHFTGPALFKTLFRHNHIAVLSVMLRRSLVDAIGFQDETPEVYGCEDWDYWLRCCKNGADFVGLNLRSFKYRVHGSGMSKDILKMQMSGCYVLFKNYDPMMFNPEERKHIEAHMLAQVREIINELYERGETEKIPYYVRLSGRFSNNKLKNAAGMFLVTLLKSKSRRLINRLICI